MEKSLEFVLNKGGNIIVFNLGFMLLLVDVNPITKKQGYKKDILIAYSIGSVKIVLTLITKVVALHIQVLIVQVRVFSL